MTNADPMAASGQMSAGVRDEGYLLPPMAGARAAAGQGNELQKSHITEVIQYFDRKTADSNSIFEEIKSLSRVKKQRLGPKRPKIVRTRGGQPANRNAYKHGKYIKELLDLRAAIRGHVRLGQDLLNEIPLHLTYGRPGRPREHW